MNSISRLFRGTFLSTTLAVVFAVGGTTLAQAQSQGIFDNESLGAVDPYQTLHDLIPTAGQIIAQKNDPTLSFNGFWDSNGNAVITTSQTATNGAWGFSFDLGGVQVTDSFSFSLDVVNLGNTAIVVLKWNDSRSNGTSVGGVKELYRISKGTVYPQPVTQGKGSATTNLPTPSGSGSGGHFEQVSADYEYGYQGDDGVYYVVAGTLYGQVWIPNPPNGSDSNKSTR
jgi:hypothetical protein